MFVLHALWRADGQLALWAEDARAHSAVTEPRPGRPTPRAHPYACPAGELAAVLGGIGPGLGWLAGQAPERWATLLLPTVGTLPAPSPDLSVTPPRGGAVLTPWRVPALLFDAGAAAQLLGEVFDPVWAVTGSDLPGAGRVEVVHGPSLRWLTGVHDLAWRTVGRGRVLPLPSLPARPRTGGAHAAEGRPQARWRPDLTPAGRREAAALAAGCPPVLLGEWPHGPGSGEALLGAALGALVDAEARAALADTPFPPPGEAGTVAERWLHALGTPDGGIDGAPPEEVAELRRRLGAWYAAAEPVDPALRLCFRLVEPLGPDPDDPQGRPSDDAWQLEFLLQAVDEPSLLVRAADLHEGGAAHAALARKADDPVDVLVAELARAAHRWPALDGLRHRSRPSVLPLDRAGALDFLRTAAPALAEGGFGVLLPAWWRRRPRLGLALRATTPPAPGSLAVTSQVDRDAVVAFRWQAALGPEGDPLTEQELAELASAKQELVRVRGTWLEADPAQIAAALAFLADRRDGVLAATELLRLALDPEATVAGLPVTSVRADGPLGELLAGQSGAAPAPELPPDFRAVLRPYQERGLAWLRTMSGLGLGAVLADDMGLGKTVQTLALLASEKAAEESSAKGAEKISEEGPEKGSERSEGATGPTLLVCPMSLVGNWQREAERFAPGLRRYVHHGAGRLGAEQLAAAVRGVDLVITTYGLVQRDLAALRAIRWRRVVADEAQHIKNTGTAQSRAIRALPVSRHRIALTGTPVENRLAELHAVLDFANPGLLGPAERFKERYAIPVELHRSPERTAELRRRTAPFVLRRVKSDPAVAAELPAKQEMTVWCNLTAEQAGLYQAVVADLLRRVEGIRGVERRGTVLAAIGKLKQVCNHPAQLLHDGSAVGGRSGKVARLAELLEEALAEGDRTLVFTQYAEFGTMLRPYLERRLGEEVLHLHGGLPRARREELVERFQSPDGPRVFLLSLRAGGTGLNLTAANQVIHLDRWWNPAVEEQATDRAFRIGQRRDVQVRRLVCVGTVEERIDELLAAKRSLARTVVGEGERWLTDLPVEALRELVALTREDAVAEEDA
ncbi:SNF2-related protein [Kitasatospora sp. NPDC057542]|uniref:SNF2-related protein n=1 Tax=Kitasatospora sp. NPDC057542 TaxID=3346162 RepID=UPI00367686F3